MTSPVVSIGSAILAGLWASVLDASIFACIVFAAIRLAKPSAATRHLLYWTVLAVAIASPVASIAASLGRVVTISVPVPTQHQVVDSSPRNLTVVQAQDAKAMTPRKQSAVPEIDITIPRSLLIGAALGIWLAVASYKAIALCFELFALHRVKRRAIALDRSRVAPLRVWNANAGMLRAATIAISRDVDVPCAAGLWAPSILLPAAVVEKQNADDIDRIVMHEAAHLARYDDWTNVFERLLGALLWFNPALAFARARIGIDREIACDDWVVARMGGAHGYATCLFRLAEATRSAEPTAHALGALGNTRHITERIEHLLSKPKRMPRGAAHALCATLGVAALAVTIVQATQAPAIAIEEPAQATALSAPSTSAQSEVSPASATAAPSPAQSTPIASIAPIATTAPAITHTVTTQHQHQAVSPLPPIPPIPPIPPNPSLSDLSRRLKNLDSEKIRRATAEASREQADAMREVAQELRQAKIDNNDAEHLRYEALREAMRAKGEALRAAAEAIHESHLGQAEIQRAMQEMQDELKHSGFLSGR
jgi:beta-lactamase regulating signal transducer with metallopeptidase domain